MKKRSVVCPACGKEGAVARFPKTYRYEESGLPLVLRGGVTEVDCPHCGESLVKIEKEEQLLQVIAKAILMSPPGMTGSEMRFVRGVIGLTQELMADALRVRRATVSERESRVEALSFADELGLRLILLRKFMAFLLTPGNNRLVAEQMKELTRFSSTFIEFADQTTRKLSRRLEAELEQDDWREKRA